MEQNAKLVLCLKMGMEALKRSGEVLLAGNINAPIEDLDEHTG